MNKNDIIKLIIYFLIAIVLFIVVDIPYLYLNNKTYSKATMDISGQSSYTKRYYSALLVYVAIALGTFVLVLPRVRTNTIKNMIIDSLIFGGVFGLSSYAIFDFTMHFMFNKWSFIISIMDSVWGGVLCSIVTFILAYIYKKYNNINLF